MSTSVGSRWIRRFELRVAAGERRERTLEAHRSYLDRHLTPALGRHQMHGITVEEVAELLTRCANGCSEKTAAGALATLHGIVRFALRSGWMVEDPVAKLEADERPLRRVVASACSAARRSVGCSPAACPDTGR